MFPLHAWNVHTAIMDSRAEGGCGHRAVNALIDSTDASSEWEISGGTDGDVHGLREARVCASDH